MISRHNYLEIAAALRHSRPVKLKGYKYQQWLLDREYLIQYFAKDNPSFDALKFRMHTEVTLTWENNVSGQ